MKRISTLLTAIILGLGAAWLVTLLTSCSSGEYELVYDNQTHTLESRKDRDARHTEDLDTEIQPRGGAQHSDKCWIELQDDEPYITCTNGIHIAARQAGEPGPQGVAGASGAQGETGAEGGTGENGQDGEDGSDGAPGAAGSIVTIVYACPLTVGPLSEAFLCVDNYLYAVFVGSPSTYDVRYIRIPPGSYVTTDGRSCAFSYTAGCALD